MSTGYKNVRRINLYRRAAGTRLGFSGSSSRATLPRSWSGCYGWSQTPSLMTPASPSPLNSTRAMTSFQLLIPRMQLKDILMVMPPLFLLVLIFSSTTVSTFYLHRASQLEPISEIEKASHQGTLGKLHNTLQAEI